MNRVQLEAITRYAAEPDLDEAAGACLLLALDGWQPDVVHEPTLPNPARQAALINRPHRENVQRIADELAIHRHALTVITGDKP